MKAFDRSVVTACMVVQMSFHSPAAVLHVSQASSNPVSPYTSWSLAATNIQDALNAANPGDQILVTNGTYQTGSRVMADGTTNRVAITNAVTLQSVNGATATIINGSQTMRCVYLTNGAVLIGFTLTNGIAANGGGAWCASTNALLMNCVLANNTATTPQASGTGGGAYSGTLSNCTLRANGSTSGGGAYASVLYDCTLIANTARNGGGAYTSYLYNCNLEGNQVSGGAASGAGARLSFLNGCRILNNTIAPGGGSGGGVHSSTLTNCLISGNTGNPGGGASASILNRCTLAGNSADGGYGGGAYGNSKLFNCILSNNFAGYGGGASGCELNNCLLITNSGSGGGGGAYNSTLNNCTVVHNRSTGAGSLYGGGVYGGGVNNSIVYYNTGGSFPNTKVAGLNYTCTPDPGGTGCITNAPLFVNQDANDFRLQPFSPCINSGWVSYAPPGLDLHGANRVVGGSVDMGPYEYQSPASLLSYAWLQQHGMPTDGSADFQDGDGDGKNNWEEWRCDTNPTNSLSVMELLTPLHSGVGMSLSWRSVNTRSYFIERSTNFPGQLSYSIIQSNIPGQTNITTHLDATATNGVRFIYRVGVQ